MHRTGVSAWLRAIVVLVSLAAASGVCLAHGEGPPSPPPYPNPPEPPVGVRADWVYPARWSWLHWWEANRDRYLERIRQGREGQKPAQQVIARFRAQAVEALLEATKCDRWQAQASAALALGMMGEQTASRPLKALVATGRSGSVRVFSLIALGLLNSASAEQALRAGAAGGSEVREARLVGMGLLTRPGPAVVVGFQRAVRGREIGPATMAAWALRHHADPANARFLQAVLADTNSPWLASEAILAFGETGDAKCIAPLANMLLATPEGKSLRSWRQLQARHQKLVGLKLSLEARQKAYDQAHAEYVQEYRKWQQNNPNRPGPGIQDRQDPLVTAGITLGVERIYQSRLRASAAIALGRIDHPKSRLALREALSQRDDRFSDLYKGFAIMALGELGDPEIMPYLVELVRPGRAGPVRKGAEKRESPLRGYAALAMGLYARPAQTPQGPRNRPGHEKVCRMLAERMADREEEDEVRAAAALGLGLAGRTENLKLLQPASRTVRGRDEVLAGYTLLARGMLGDTNIVPAAKKLLDPRNDRTDPEGILARRAGVLALGVLGAQEGVPILADAWTQSYYVNREAALAYSLCEAYNVTEPLVKLLRDSENPLEQAFAARCLGELFTAVRPSRLCRLTSHGNYTMKNLKLVRLQALANEYLFCYLIPRFGKDWR